MAVENTPSIHQGAALSLSRRRFLLLGCGASSLVLLPACAGATPTQPTQAAKPAAPTSAASSAPAPAAAPSQPVQVGPGGFGGGGSLKILLNAHFIPAYDVWVDKWAAEWATKNRVDVTIDHILSAQTAQKIAAEVASAAGHDMIRFTRSGEVNLFHESLVDVSDLAKQIGQQYGGWVLPLSEQVGMHEGVWKGVPEYFVDRPSIYRKDLFDANGLKSPQTWQELLKAGEVLKVQGHPVGLGISQQSNDAVNTWNSVFWCYGASYVAKDGKTLTVNTPEMKEAMSFAVEIYNKAMTNEVLTWDDSANNQFLASGRGSWIHNPISATRTIEKDNPELAKHLYIDNPPGGPKGRFASVSTNVFGIMSWSKSAPAARAFLTDYFAMYAEAVKVSEGYNQPLLKAFRKKPMPILGEDPKLQILQDFDEIARVSGHPGPPTEPSGEVDNNWILPLMIGQAIQGATIDDAIKWGEAKIKAIYDKYK